MTPAPTRLPAEWEEQSAVMLTWPHADSDWGPILDRVEQTYTEIACQISLHQPLIVVCRDEAHRQQVRDRLELGGADEEDLTLVTASSDDSWTRDHGPITVYRDHQPTLLDFRFNGWGGKYPADQDNRITRSLHGHGLFGATPIESIPLVLEGGAIESDGAGTLLATRRSVISETRNPGLSQPQLEQQLQQALGIERFLWLEHGSLSGDDTDGHIDTLARFCDSETIIHVTATPDDPDYPPLRRMQEELSEFRTVEGHPYELIELPPVTPVISKDGRRLPASYANFLLINSALLLPVYQDENDDAAVACLRESFVDHDIIPIDCRALIEQNGSLHCITMQLPAGVEIDSVE